MEEQILKANMILIILEVLFSLTLVFFYIFGVVFLKKAIYKENDENMKYFFPFLTYNNHLLNLMSPKIKLITIYKLFSIEIIASVFILLFWFGFLDFLSEANFELFFQHYLVFILITLLDISLIIGTIIYIFIKKSRLETDNQTLRNEFQDFLETWINNNSLKQAIFVFEFDNGNQNSLFKFNSKFNSQINSMNNNLFVYKYNYFVYDCLVRVKNRTNFQENNYDVIYQFRYYLTNMRKNFDELLENVISVNGVYSTDENFVSELKKALVNNFVFALKQ